MSHYCRLSLLASLLVVWHVQLAHAQAWVGPERSLSASINYDFSRSNSIVEEPDIKIGGEPIISHAVLAGLEFVPIEKLAIAATLPFLMTKYQGTGTLFPRHGRYDDGKLHATLQDFRLATRYQVLAEPFAFSPHIAFTVPVADYETLGYANAGRHLKQAHLGAAVGRLFGNLYVHAQYEFTLSEKFDATAETEEIGQNRSDLSATVGYAVLDGKLDFSLGGNFRFAHGGIRFIDFNDLSPDLQMFHDPLLREEFILVGAGAAYQITEKLRVALVGRLFVRGRNTRNANSVGVGASWDIL